MKKLTMNRVASAGLRANRRAYISLAAGIFLSIFIISTICLCVQSIMLDMRRDVIASMGSEDVLLYDSDRTDEQLKDMGWFDVIGHAAVTGSIKDRARYIGYYDEAAEALLNRRLLEGRMPERAGEIAVESTVLDMLEMDIRPGDALELEVTPIDGKLEVRQYTLTGILADQSSEMSVSNTIITATHQQVLEMPALLVCADEPAFDTGRTVVQRVMTLQRNKNGNKLIDAWKYDSDGMLAVVSPYYGRLNTGYEYWGSDFVSPQVFCILLLGAALLLVCGIGIAGSMESRLVQRVEQIGMLRAVGATGRQIRRMYGREAWLLALIISPLAIGAAYAAVYIASRLLPENLVFAPSPLLLLPVLGFSVIVVVLSSSLPLKRASRIMPMQILRDTRTLKRLRKVKSRRHFRPAQLVARRQASLHAGRMVAPAALIALTMAVLLFAVQLGAQIIASYDYSDFLLYNFDPTGYGFCELVPERALTDGDIAQLAAMPDVGKVDVRRIANVLLPLDSECEYFMEAEDDPMYQTSPVDLPTDYLKLDNGWQDGTDGLNPAALTFSRHNWGAQYKLDTEKRLLPLYLYAMDVSLLKDVVTEGCIDIDALDRGEQVLIYVPDLYRHVDQDGQVDVGMYQRDRSYKLFRKNDYFYEGQSVALCQLRVSPDDVKGLGDSQADYERLYGSASVRQAEFTIGAVLTRYDHQLYSACLITTERGAKVMGLDVDHTEEVSIRLSGPVSIAREEALFQRITAIAARGGMNAIDRLKSRRENGQERRMAMITFAAVCIVFLAAAVGLISGTIHRRVMADARAIGTLRAVGASEGTIRSCYSGQVTLTLLLGCVMGGILFLLYWRFARYLPTGASPVLIAGSQVVALMILWGACALMLRRSVRMVTRKSIIENIREL